MKKIFVRSVLAIPVLMAASVLGQTTQPASAQPANGQLTGAPAAVQPAGDQVGKGSRVLVISIDGCRPDVALRADMPNFRELLKEGSFTMYARTTFVAITLPSHTSMITGVTPDKHQVTWNTDLEESDPKFHYPLYPTLMELAHKAGYTTALVAAKSKFVTLAKPGTVDWQAIPTGAAVTDCDQTADNAVKIIAAHKPNVMMLHFGDADGVGHAVGWGTPQQVQSLERIDKAMGEVLQALKAAGVYKDTLIILSADHGGYGKTHGGPDQRSAYIPWVAVGPNIKPNFDLTRMMDTQVHTEDTFATAASFLGLTIARDIDGHPVAAIWNRKELMQDNPGVAADGKKKKTLDAP